MAKPDAVARSGRRELSCAECCSRASKRRERSRATIPAPSDLEQAAAWVAHWRSRVDSAPPVVARGSRETQESLPAASQALRELLQCANSSGLVACSPAGLAATEEIGASLLANTVLVYPTPELMTIRHSFAAGWKRKIFRRLLPAAMWHSPLNAWAAARKSRLPAKLRLVVVTEGEPNEGSFGRITTTRKTISGFAGASC